MADTLGTPTAAGQTATAAARRAAIPEHPDGGRWSDPMQPDPPTPTRARHGRRALVPVLALLLAGAATACAQEADGGLDARTDGTPGAGGGTEFAATADYLASAVDSSQAEAYRFQAGIDMGLGPIQADAPDLMTGQRVDDRSSLTMDLGGLYDDMGIPGLDGDLTMEMVSDGKQLFVRAPVFETLSELPGVTGAGPMGSLADLGDKWGRVDLTALGDKVATSRLLSKAGVQNGDPTVLLDIVKQADDVEELGSDTSRGDTVQGLRAVLTFEEMLEAQGLDVDDYFGSMASSLPAEADGLFDRMRDLELPVEVWVDGDDHVRRVELTVDMGEFLGEVADTEGMGDFAVTSSMELYDYGDDSIQVELPTDAVDVTDDFLSGLEG